MRRKTFTIPVLAAALSGALSAQVGVGDTMPEVAVDAKFNLEPFELERLSGLRGPAFLVEYWATW